MLLSSGESLVMRSEGNLMFLSSGEVVQFSAGVFAWFFGGTLQLVEPKQVLGEDHKPSFAGCSALPSTVKTINPTIALRIREA